MQDILLNRQVDLQKYEVLLEIGRQTRRPEIHSVLMLVQESSSGKVTTSLICDRLFRGRPEALGRAMMNRCQQLGLLDSAGNLTREGEAALQTGLVFVPERGKYLIWYSEDSLLPQNLLHLEPLDEVTINDELAIRRRSRSSSTGASSNNGEDFDTPVETPPSILSMKGKTFDLMGKGGGTVSIKEIENKCARQQLGPGDQIEAFLTISEFSGCNLRIQGKFTKSLTGPVLKFGDVFLDALGSRRDMWDEKRIPNSLRCRFVDLDERELNNFLKDVHVTKPRLRKLGEFRDTTLKEVPISPHSLEDAEHWALWRLRRTVDSYLNQDAYDERVRATKAKFPDYATRIRLPSQKELAQQIRSQSVVGGPLPEEYWYLQAPLDLVSSTRQS